MGNQFVKEQIRAWLQERIAKPCPPPEPEQIRRAVGWSTAEKNKVAAKETDASKVVAA